MAQARPDEPSTFGSLLRHWRQARRLRRACLAEQARLSAGQLSALESGHSGPSRDLVLVLGSTLSLSLRERNALLQAAGFAPAYAHHDLDDPELEPVRQAVALLLEAHAPFPAVAMDSAWTFLRGNETFFPADEDSQAVLHLLAG